MTIFVAAFIIAGGVSVLNAQSVDELKNEIKSSSEKIAELEKEIAEYQKELAEIGEEKASLQNKVRSVDLTRKKLDTDIRLTENRINAADSNIHTLQLDIQDKKSSIDDRMRTIESVIRRIDKLEKKSLVEMMFASRDLSDFWDEAHTLQRFQGRLRANVDELRSLKNTQEENKEELEKEQKNLVALKEKLADQRTIVNQTLAAKQRELTETRTTEAQFQKQLEERKQLKEEFEQELRALESELQVKIDPNSIPSAGSGILRQPIPDATVTQYFGNTQFAQSGGYNGNGHNGVDFRASIGTEVRAALSGTVRGAGNTDAVSGCYSYGKWVLIEHNNGLASLYAHLSLIRASEGEQVSTGDIIGYSGNTGYSTGPHLHFGVYASQGVEIVRLGDVKKITNCGDAHIPIAPLDAYLNPLDYL